MNTIRNKVHGNVSIAERALRNNVVMRKIFGGSRSFKGAKVMETNITVIDTLRERNPGKTFFEVVLPRLKEFRGDEDGVVCSLVVSSYPCPQQEYALLKFF